MTEKNRFNLKYEGKKMRLIKNMTQLFSRSLKVCAPIFRVKLKYDLNFFGLIKDTTGKKRADKKHFCKKSGIKKVWSRFFCFSSALRKILPTISRVYKPSAPPTPLVLPKHASSHFQSSPLKTSAVK